MNTSKNTQKEIFLQEPIKFRRKKKMLGTVWGIAAVGMTNLMMLTAMYRQFFPPFLRVHFEKYMYKIFGWASPNVHIKFPEYTGEGLKRSNAYSAIRNYLTANSTAHSKRLKANDSKNTKSVVLCMDDYEEVEDVFNDVKVKWSSHVRMTRNESRWDRSSDERRSFMLTFHMRDRQMITEIYIDHVLREGKAIGVKNRERKLFTNNSSQDWFSWREGKWSSVLFEHPASFDTLAMDPVQKEYIKKDLIKFSRGKEYYKKVGKAWKRGYLLHGPPGTGKSTMISAMANFLDYDVYDLELTTVKDNSELKRLLLDTTAKSIIVIEDIDCSLDLTGQRKKKKEEEDEEDEDEKKEKEKKVKRENHEKQSKVTLSGLLNAIDGLWSACSGEKIIVFTTNFLDKLDPALIRRGRMDNHIEMGYCRFEAFKVLAINYLDIESHDMYGEIKRLLEETNMSPADVAENLMPKSEDEDEDICLKRLVLALEDEKEKAKMRAEEEEEERKAKEEKKKKKKAKEEEEERKTKEESKKKKKKAQEEEEEEEEREVKDEKKKKKKAQDEDGDEDKDKDQDEDGDKEEDDDKDKEEKKKKKNKTKIKTIATL